MPAYTGLAAPALFMVLAVFVRDLWQSAQTSRSYKIVSTILAILPFLLAVRYCIERVKPFRDRSAQLETRQKIFRLHERVQAQSANPLVFNCAYPMESRFYTGLPCFGELPSLHILRMLKARGYDVFVIENAAVSDEYRKHPRNSIISF